MFVTDLFAALAPVLPFAFLPLGSARTLSLVVTTMLVLLLGVGRGLIGHKNVVVTAVQTLAIAAVAGGAGLLVSSLISGHQRGYRAEFQDGSRLFGCLAFILRFGLVREAWRVL